MATITHIVLALFLLSLYLQNVRYAAACLQGPDWCFTSPLPQWARDDWNYSASDTEMH